jgi:hypothetical protein
MKNPLRSRSAIDGVDTEAHNQTNDGDFHRKPPTQLSGTPRPYGRAR